MRKDPYRINHLEGALEKWTDDYNRLYGVIDRKASWGCNSVECLPCVHRAMALSSRTSENKTKQKAETGRHNSDLWGGGQNPLGDRAGAGGLDSSEARGAEQLGKTAGCSEPQGGSIPLPSGV
jgi:hypothetical protein